MLSTIKEQQTVWLTNLLADIPASHKSAIAETLWKALPRCNAKSEARFLAWVRLRLKKADLPALSMDSVKNGGTLLILVRHDGNGSPLIWKLPARDRAFAESHWPPRLKNNGEPYLNAVIDEVGQTYGPAIASIIESSQIEWPPVQVRRMIEAFEMSRKVFSISNFRLAAMNLFGGEAIKPIDDLEARQWSLCKTWNIYPLRKCAGVLTDCTNRESSSNGSVS